MRRRCQEIWGRAFQVEGPAATRPRGGSGLGVSEEETEGQGVWSRGDGEQNGVWVSS